MRFTLHTSNFYCVVIIIGVLRARRSGRHRTGSSAIVGTSINIRLQSSLLFTNRATCGVSTLFSRLAIPVAYAPILEASWPAQGVHLQLTSSPTASNSAASLKSTTWICARLRRNCACLNSAALRHLVEDLLRDDLTICFVTISCLI